ncbi:MAG: transglutaminaseTgpA domain-containing protein, partial [Propionibacteriaceae bacterium]|nr:transglutaminaseTgpA domain-containing protein [Propionibacteriaceae bacterium]
MRIAHPDRQPETRSRTRTLTARLASLKPSRHDQIDGVFVLGLLLVAFSGFVTSFDSAQLWLVIGIGLAVGLVTAHVAITWEWPWIVVAVVCGLWYFLLGTPLALPSEAIGRLLPSSRSLSILATLPVSGWKGMLTTLPPLGARGTYAALVLLLALLSSAASFLVARRAQRPAVALAIPLLTAALVLALGTLDLFYPRWQGAVLGLLSFGWLANRFPRRRRLLGVQKLRRSSAVLGAGLLAVGVAGGVLLGPVLPGTVGKPRLVARSYVQPPIDMRDYVSPLVGFRKYSSKELDLYYDTPMLEVDGLDPGMWVRFAALDAYNGHVWSATGDEADPNTGFLRLGSRVPNPPLDGVRQARITVLEGYAASTDLNPWVPGFGRVSAMKFGGRFAREHAAALRFNLSTQQALLPDRLKPKDTITMAAAPLRTLDQLPAETRPGEARRLPDQASDFLVSLAQSSGGEQPMPLARLKSAAEKLRAGAWSDGSLSGEKHFLPGHGKFRLSAFASGQELVGSDEQYSAVFALIANRYGFPARVAFGARIPDEGP